jgi:hypothetical protein
VPKTDLTVIKQLQAELRNKEQTITQLHITWLLLLGVSILLLLNTVRLSGKRRVKKR